MTDIQAFGFEGTDVRTVMIDGEPWFIAKDVCDVLGLGQVSRALDRLESDERGLVKVTHPQSVAASLEMATVNESGLYTLILRSDKPDAKRFRKWVTSEVLPSIRKHGGYLSPAVDFSDPENIQSILDNWKKDRAARLEAEARVKRLTHIGRNYSTTELAKELGYRSAQELNQKLHDMGIIYKDNRGVWLLYSEYADKGFQSIKQGEKGGVVVYFSAWTGLGRDWVIGLLSDKNQTPEE